MSESTPPNQGDWYAPREQAPLLPPPLDGVIVKEKHELRNARTAELRGAGIRDGTVTLTKGPLVSNVALEANLGISAPGIEVVASVENSRNPNMTTFIFREHLRGGGSQLIVVPASRVAEGVAMRDSTLNWPNYLKDEHNGGQVLEGLNPQKGINFKANGQPFNARQDREQDKAFTVIFDLRNDQTTVRNRSEFYTTSVTYNRQAEVGL